MTARPWYADQPEPVRGVIVLAETRQVISVDEWALIVATFAPANAEVLSDIADALPWIDTFESDKSAEMLRRYFEDRTASVSFPFGAAPFAEELLARLKRDVILWASGVASLARAGAA